MAEPRRTGRATIVAWSFVAAQFALIGLMVFAPRARGFDLGAAGRIAGIGLMVAGGALGLWSAVYLGRGLTPSPLPNGSVDLVVAGPYRWARHPMYVAVMLFMAGVAIRSGSWLVVAAFGGLVVLFSVKARWEEAHLRDAFPGYERYGERTRRFFPGPGTTSARSDTTTTAQSTTDEESR
jgi:protein-S-isoprenylcysteine O-methyltransferase Ste14